MGDTGAGTGVGGAGAGDRGECGCVRAAGGGGVSRAGGRGTRMRWVRGVCVSMAAAGIVDPTLVVKGALEQAASGAAMLISAEALVVPREPEAVYRP